jgi:hypothetical protein
MATGHAATPNSRTFAYKTGRAELSRKSDRKQSIEPLECHAALCCVTQELRLRWITRPVRRAQFSVCGYLRKTDRMRKV